MLPTNAASDISMQDALDLLHKFRTESTRVLAVFLRYSPSSGAKVPMAVVMGVVWEGAEGLFAVSTRSDFKGCFLGFHPKLASSFKYGDDRIVGNFLPAWPSSYFVLTFCYDDECIVALFEHTEIDSASTET
jgi:hypothetical protein